jgi:hypothetical protein
MLNSNLLLDFVYLFALSGTKELMEKELTSGLLGCKAIVFITGTLISVAFGIWEFRAADDEGQHS